jgi:hypothetical protein
MTRSKRKRKSATVPIRAISGWAIGGAALVTLIIGVSILLSIRPNGKSGKIPPPAESTDSEPNTDEEPEAFSDWKGPLPEEIARLFTEAKTHEERMELIADPRHDGSWMKSFFSEGPGAEEKISAVAPMGAANTNKTSFQRFQVRLSKGKSRLLCVILSENGGAVDFRSYARFCTESWEDLLAGRTAIAEEVRVFIEPAFAYLHNYTDDKQWASYVATSPDLDQPLYFYVARGSDTAMQMSKITRGGNMRATLAIRSVDGGHLHRQFEVTEVLTSGWVK